MKKQAAGSEKAFFSKSGTSCNIQVKRFDRLWRSGMRVSKEGGMFWIHAIIQSTAFDETLCYCHCFDPVKLRDDQFAALKAAWECG